MTPPRPFPSVHCALILLIALILGLSSISPAGAQEIPNEGPAPGNIGKLPNPIVQRHVYDYADLLNDGQEASIESDAARLQRFGVPTLILVQASDMPADDAAAFAGELMQGWGVESAPGAADGLVMLVMVDRTDEKNVYTVMAWGEHALPHNGIDRAVASSIHDQWLDAYAQNGHIYEGILYALRRLVYHSIYDPAPAGPLSDTRSTAQSIVTWIAPVVALVAAAAAVARGTGWLVPRRPGAATLADVEVWVIPVVAVVIAALAVWSESASGVLSALILACVATIGWVRRDPALHAPGAHGRVAR